MKKKIILKQMKNFEVIVSWDNSRTCWVLEDSDENPITTFKDKSIFSKLEQITSIGDLQNLGLVLNVMWGDSLFNLYIEWLKYLYNIKDQFYRDYTYDEFIENLPINIISNGKEFIYFIVDYTEV
jgi:hypothetical protein